MLPHPTREMRRHRRRHAACRAGRPPFPRRCARTRPCCPLVFLVLFSTVDGIRDVDPDLIESLEIMGASRFEIATKLIIPAAKPWTFMGMRISVRYATTAAISAR